MLSVRGFGTHFLGECLKLSLVDADSGCRRGRRRGQVEIEVEHYRGNDFDGDRRHVWMVRLGMIRSQVADTDRQIDTHMVLVPHIEG